MPLDAHVNSPISAGKFCEIGLETFGEMILRCFVVAILFLLFASCSRTESTRHFKVGFSQCTGADAWRRQMLMAMKGELVFHPEIEFEYRDAGNSNERQVADIEYFLKEKVDLLIVSPNEAAPITPVVERVFQSGIPVIVVDRKTSSSLYTAYIGADNYEIGRLAGGYIAEILRQKGTVLEIFGLRGSSPAIDRHKGLWEVLSQYPEIKTAGEIDGMWEKDTATSVAARRAMDLPSADVVFAHNDVMAYGVYTVYRDLFPDNKIKFIGIDALPGPGAGIQFVDDRILTASFLYPTGGEEAIQIASQVLHGQPFQKENILHSTVVDSKNVRVMKLQTDKILTQQTDIVRQQSKINEQIQTYYSQRILIYILLFCLVVMIVVGAMAILSWKEKKEANKHLEHKSNEILAQKNTIAEMADKAERATQEKLKFFTNISHEFKTPLTLIMGPIEELVSKNGDAKSDKENLGTIRKNAVRLLRLVNQLMDFRKIEEKKMMLKASEVDLLAFVRDIMTAFEPVAHKRKIDFQLNCAHPQLYVWIDPDMVDKVIFNLLSNAFKFTADKGRITVTVFVDNSDHNAVIWVEDNGIGMSEEHIRHAFDRFYTGDNFKGNGLGLSLSKEFIDMHHGSLSLSSEKGKGTRFTLVLPLGNAQFDESQLVTTQREWERTKVYDGLTEDRFLPAFGEAMEEDDVFSQKDHTLLLVDDNAELRKFLRSKLRRHYNIVEAHDGTTGLNMAYNVVPDAIICDIMLPDKNGLTVSSELKADLRTSHIPIIILTAKGSMEQRIAGVQTGADEYITKPFVFEYLEERIKALIKNRQILKEHYSHDVAIDPHLTAPGGLDRKFINSFTALVEKNTGNSEFHVNDIARELGMSRVQIYRKVKALLGYSVNEYVMNVRLKKARHLLHTDKSVSEVAAEVGFSSPTYFSTAFKQKFNISPKDFKQVPKTES
jgi:signal transduction histidine kinase/DNA-binding response OmpR family regulator